MLELLRFPFSGLGTDLKSVCRSIYWIFMLRIKLIFNLCGYLREAKGLNQSKRLLLLVSRMRNFRLRTNVRHFRASACRTCTEKTRDLSQHLQRGALQEIAQRVPLRQSAIVLEHFPPFENLEIPTDQAEKKEETKSEGLHTSEE